MSKEKFIYAGKLVLQSNGEESDILFLKGEGDPLAETLQDEISCKFVSCRYWITEEQVSIDEAQEMFLKKLFGALKSEYLMQFSEATGYLWTDEELNVGGHDLLTELKSHAGAWLILELETADEQPNR